MHAKWEKVMEKKNVKLNTLLNLACVLLIAIVLIFSFTSFWHFNDRSASIHELIGWPSDNVDLQHYIIEKTHTDSFIDTSKNLLNYNAFVVAPIFLIVGGLIGGFVVALKSKSRFAWIFNIVYGIAGILTFSLIDFFRLGSTWKIQLFLYILITLVAIAQIILEFFVDKEIEVPVNNEKVFKDLVVLFAAATVVFLIATSITNMKYKRQIKTSDDLKEEIELRDKKIRDYEREEEEEDDGGLISIDELCDQVENLNIDADGKELAKALISGITDGTVICDDPATANRLLGLIKFGTGVNGDNKQEIIDMLKALEITDEFEGYNTEEAEETEETENTENTETSENNPGGV